MITTFVLSLEADSMFANNTSLRPVLVILSVCSFASGAAAQDAPDAVLKPYLVKYELPALAAVVVKDDKIIAAFTAGTRRVGTRIPVTLNDRFHIGSNTKAMTALLAAMLVEEKKLRWDSTMAEVFPELVKSMDARLKGVTLEQLLTHTSGIPGDNKELEGLYTKSMVQEGNLDEIRYWLVKQVSRLPLASEPGKKWAYSNMGYTTAGAMIERAAGKTWDELMHERLFTPLGLKTAGLGCQSSLGKIDAPLGHKIIEGKTKAFLAGPDGDSPAVLGPAGIAHMSVLDYARWAGWNAAGGKRGPKLVEPATMRKLHTMVVSLPEIKDARPGTPSKGKYGLGWGEVAVEWAAEPLLFHGGSNEMNLAHIWIEPKRDVAMVLVTNIGGKKAQDALFKLAAQLYAKYAAPKDSKDSKDSKDKR
jgi:CubicO group peptidase (beta-lactamase class C family)